MSFESVLEQQRRAHEERERLMDTMTKEMLRKKATHREQINSEHMVKLLLDRYAETSTRLKDIYDDKDGSRKAEIQALSGPNEFTEFYIRLKQIEQYYIKNPSEETAIPMSIEYEHLMRQLQETEDGEPLALAIFTDEEGYGRFLDLHQCYDFYLNIKGVERVDYLTYLKTFDRLFEVPKDRKTHEYRQYLSDHLLPYLLDFLKRCKPLINIEKDLENVKHDFELRWEQGIFLGWPKESGGALTKGGAPLDLSGFSSAEELASVGLDRLKSALLALGMKCGGTLEERAKRLFATKNKSVEDLDPSLFMKDNKAKRENKESSRHREIAGLEAQVYRLVELLSEQRVATLENVVRKQAKGGEDDDEIEDGDGGNISDDGSDHEEDGLIYNPKNLPLGWDGKPIPYWLYKLHGLNMYFNCEICGNHTYRGPKAFQRHFAEWRHAHGMRCLGIPNTAHFANITSIEDALALWNKIKDNKDQERWKPEIEEEFEDSRGNVVNKRTYEDLRRQGLL